MSSVAAEVANNTSNVVMMMPVISHSRSLARKEGWYVIHFLLMAMAALLKNMLACNVSASAVALDAAGVQAAPGWASNP